MQKGAKINQAARSYLKGSYEVEMFLRISIYNLFRFSKTAISD